MIYIRLFCFQKMPASSSAMMKTKKKPVCNLRWDQVHLESFSSFCLGRVECFKIEFWKCQTNRSQMLLRWSNSQIRNVCFVLCFLLDLNWLDRSSFFFNSCIEKKTADITATMSTVVPTQMKRPSSTGSHKSRTPAATPITNMVSSKPIRHVAILPSATNPPHGSHLKEPTNLSGHLMTMLSKSICWIHCCRNIYIVWGSEYNTHARSFCWRSDRINVSKDECTMRNPTFFFSLVHSIIRWINRKSNQLYNHYQF